MLFIHALLAELLQCFAVKIRRTKSSHAMNSYVRITSIMMLAGVLCMACQKKGGGDIVLQDVKVNLSDAISVPDFDKKDFNIYDTIPNGADLYQHLRTLVYVAEYSADLVNTALRTLHMYEISGPTTFTYISDDDNRIKSVIVREKIPFENETWDYELAVSDETEGKAFVIYWNRNPRRAIAFMFRKAFDFNVIFMRNTLIRLDYSESDAVFDRTMMVRLVGLDSTSVHYMSKLKMFAGQAGDVVRFYGNTIHPSAYIVDASHTGGRAWCFKGRNDVVQDIAVALCALPVISLSNNEMPILWTDYTMEKVLEAEITDAYVDIAPATLETYVKEARGAAYFIGRQGFVGNDTNIPDHPGFTSAFIDLSGFDPWAPYDIYTMNINF
jgi:hypothetical protein